MSALKNLGDVLRLPAQAERAAFIDLREDASPVALSAAGLDDLINAVARGLLKHGIQRGDRVGILADNGVEFVASYFGIMRIGAIAVPINHRLPGDIVLHIIEDAGLRLTFCDARHRPKLPADIEIIQFGDAGTRGFESFLSPGRYPAITPAAGEIAEILYTSGSTGKPKGVPLSHQGQLWAISQYLRPTLASANDSTVVVAPLYHMNGLFFTCVALANRITIFSMPRFDARRYLQTVAQHRCTILSGIPTMFALMMRERDLLDTLNFDCVREISLGSAPLTDTLVRQVENLFPRASLKNSYGTTEAGPAVFGPHPDGLPTPALSPGHPLPGVQWRLLGEESAREGVLELNTPALMQGYLNLPSITRQRLREGWYRTGDVMRRDSDGFFYFVGRDDDMFVCSGENLYPSEIERRLESHPDVAQAVVVAAPDDLRGQIPVAFVTLRPGARADAETIKQHALAQGPAYAQPRFVVFLDTLPVSGTHKIDRATLMRQAQQLAEAAGRFNSSTQQP